MNDLNHIRIASEALDGIEDFFPIFSSGDPCRDDKKVKSKRFRSPYRDASFRQQLQAVAVPSDSRGNSGTSVTLPVAPSLTPTATPTHTNANTDPLTPPERNRTERFWRAYCAEITCHPKFKTPAPWRDLSDQYRLEWFNQACAFADGHYDFTLNFSPEIEEQVRGASNSAKWLSARIARRLKQLTGASVDFWFAFDVSDKRRLHIHGELAGIHADQLPAVRKALRLAGGEWEQIRQHQTHLRANPSLVWANYAAKNSFAVRPLSGRLSKLPRPIAGDWFFATNSVRSSARSLYEEARKRAVFQASNTSQS